MTNSCASSREYNSISSRIRLSIGNNIWFGSLSICDGDIERLDWADGTSTIELESDGEEISSTLDDCCWANAVKRILLTISSTTKLVNVAEWLGDNSLSICFIISLIISDTSLIMGSTKKRKLFDLDDSLNRSFQI